MKEPSKINLRENNTLITFQVKYYERTEQMTHYERFHNYFIVAIKNGKETIIVKNLMYNDANQLLKGDEHTDPRIFLIYDKFIFKRFTVRFLIFLIILIFCIFWYKSINY